LVTGGARESTRKFFRKLAGDRGDEFADMTLKTVASVVKGIIGVALILALLHGVIFMLAGIPYAGIWTLLVFVLCILQLPVVFITLPIMIYIFAQMELMPAIIWTVLLLVAGLSDNVLKPILLGKGAPVPMLVIFIGVIGGFILSGFIGLFTGAIVMSIGYKLFVGWINSNNAGDQVQE
jgi:predicted PurR-regulated permease PerM